jgi:SWIM zinc finger
LSLKPPRKFKTLLPGRHNAIVFFLAAIECEVFSLEKNITYVIKLDFMTCTCFEWQSTGILCAHAIAFILGRKEDPQTYTQAFLSLEAYQKSYAQILHPPNANHANKFNNKTFILPPQSDSNSYNKDNNSDDVKYKIKPPYARRAPGRPQKRRIQNGVEGLFGGKRQKKVLTLQWIWSCSHNL